MAGRIPAEAPRAIAGGNILLAGDAAGHTHPITGAGIVQAVIGGRMAGKWAARAVESGDMNNLANYESEWMDFFGKHSTEAFPVAGCSETQMGPTRRNLSSTAGSHSKNTMKPMNEIMETGQTGNME